MRANQLCSQHNQQRSRGIDLKPIRAYAQKGCSFDGCTEPHKARGFCVGHWWQLKSGASELRPLWDWLRQVGDRRVDKSGYAWLKIGPAGTPGCNSAGWMLEHRHVMEGLLARPLASGEEVHHKNGVRDDNRPENLELWVTKQPKGQRPEDLVAWAWEVIGRYDPEELSRDPG